jgi:DNA-binding PucR family transcriptional regulator
VRATAAGLAIHENTVRHRFRRLAAATGLDVLGSTDDRLTARMALTLHRLSSNAPARKEPK